MGSNTQAQEVFENCWKIVNQPLGTNSYIFLSHDEKEALIIDPGFYRGLIEEFLKSHQLKVRAILCTHGHFDHIASVEDLRMAHAAKCYIHASDLKVVKTANFLMMACKIPGKVMSPKFEVLVSDPVQSVKFENFPEIVWNHLPGHTPGSSALLFDDKLVFTGDSLYASTVSLVSLPGEDPALLAQSLSRLLRNLKKETIVLPGHGCHASVSEILRDNKQLKSFLNSQQVDTSIFA